VSEDYQNGTSFVVYSAKVFKNSTILSLPPLSTDWPSQSTRNEIPFAHRFVDRDGG
jgi:hypothetical protein